MRHSIRDALWRWPARHWAAFIVCAVLSACSPLASVAPTSVSVVAAPAPPASGAEPAALPAGVVGYYLAGKVAEDDHDFVGASALLEQALLADPDNLELLLRVTICLAADGHLTEASAVARRLAGFDPNAFVAAFVLAEQRAKGADWTGVQQAVAGLPRRGVTLLLIPLIDAWARMAEGEIDGALETLKPLKAINGMAAVYQFHVALINDLADRQMAAAVAYDETLRLPDGLTLRTVEAASEFFRRIGQPDKAAEYLRRFHQARPETSFSGEADGVRAVTSATDGMAESFFGTAESVRAGKAPELTLAFVQMALDLRPDFPLAQIQLAETLQAAGQTDAADHVFRGLRRSSPFYWSGQLRIADNLDARGQTDAALQILTEVSAAFPKRIEPLIAIGELLRRHKKWADAIVAYDRAIANQGEPERGQWYVYYARGIAEERNRQWERAEADFSHALDLQPGEPQVLNYLGYSWLERGIHFEQARRMIEQAAAARPNDGAIVDSMGWAQYRVGDFAHAVETLEHAVELDPADATVNDHLGDALWRVGRRNEARFQWNRALIYAPEPELLAAIQKKLKAGLRTAPSPRSGAAAP